MPTEKLTHLDALPGLVDRARSAGLRADVDVDVAAVEVPSAVGGAAFRIVQEALTNVLRHADASNAVVRVRVRSGALDIEITDDGLGANGGAVTAGYGVRGMTERTMALGGRIRAGPRAEGGWRVHAMLPLNGKDSR